MVATSADTDPDPRSEDSEFESGRRLGPYVIVRLLGRGGMGAVYEATHTHLQKRVALKILKNDPAADPDSRERFLREGRAASRVHHPHVVDVTDFGAERGSACYLVMEYLRGEDLATYCKREGALPVEQAVDILLPILSGVAAAHDEGIVHRDLKPANIFLTRGSRSGAFHPKVLDFGVAKTTGLGHQPITVTASMIGTPQYLSPEQARNSKDVTARSDQYSLGLILYECVTGTQPFQGESLLDVLQAVVKGDVLAPHEFPNHIPERFSTVVLKAMHVKPELRFPTVRHFGRELLPFASEPIRVAFGDEFENPSKPPRAGESGPPTPLVGPPTPPSVPTVRAAGSSDLTAAAEDVSGTDQGVEVTEDDSNTAVLRRPKVLFPETSRTIRRRRRSNRRRLVGVMIAVTVAAGIVIGVSLQSDPAPINPVASAATDRSTRPPVRVRLSVNPPTAAIAIDGEAIGTGDVDREFSADGRLHRLSVSAPGFATQEIVFREELPVDHIDLTPILEPEPAPSPPLREEERSPEESLPAKVRSRGSRRATETHSLDSSPAPPRVEIRPNGSPLLP